jgi:hypothetical protein
MRDPLEDIRSGKARLAAHRTARIEVTYRLADLDPDDESRLAGVVDFEQGRYRTSGDSEEHVVIGGMSLTRGEGETRWSVVGDDPAAAPAPGDVLWMLDLLAGVVKAEEIHSPQPDRSSYACQLDLLRADDRSASGVSMPGGFTVRQVRHLGLQVDLDHESLVRTIGLSLPDRLSSTVEFIELGVSFPPIEPPPADQQVRVWELLDDEED